MLERLMDSLVKDLELEASLATEVPGTYAFPLDQGLTVMISEIPRGFSLKCLVGPCPTLKEDQFLKQAMLANLFGQGTHGSVLGLTPEGNIITLTQVVDYTIDYKDFRDILEDFINIVDFWYDESRK